MISDQAVALATQGFRVHPLNWVTDEGACSCELGAECPPKNRGKHPRLSAWQKKATTDVGIIRDWWRKWPCANIGVATGEGLYVLDVDPANGGEESFAALGDLPATLTVRTATGGRHLYFKTAENFRNTAGKLGPGLDTRGTGGYVVGPGSMRLEGIYEVVSDAPIADIPRVLLPKPRPVLPLPKITTERPRNLAKRVEALLRKCPPAVAGNYGHNRALATACAVGPGFNLDPEEAYVWLATEWNPRCDPPWSEPDLRRKVSEAYKIETRRGWLLAERRPLPKHAAPRDEPGQVIPFPTQRQIIPGIGPDSISSIEKLVKEHLGLLLGSDAPLRMNSLTNDIEHAGKCFDLDDLVTRLRISAEEKLCYETGKTDETGRPVTPMLRLSAPDTAAVIVHVARQNTYSPVREWLESLPAFEPGAIAMAATEALGLTDDLSLLLWRKWLIGCVARVMEPGCQMDTVLTLVAPKGGERKSSMFRALVGKWFSDTHLDMTGFKRENAYMQLHRVWVYEVPELEAAQSKADRSRIKSFISSRSDDFRAPYDAKVNAHPRAVVTGATTNDLGFMASDDPAFNRRFWPVRILGTIDTEMVEKLREQIWADALAAYRAHEPWHITPDQEAIVAKLAERHEDFAEEDAWTPRIKAYLESPEAAGKALMMIDIVRSALHIEDGKITLQDQHRVGAILGPLGWVRRRARWTQDEKDARKKSWRWVDGSLESKGQAPWLEDQGDP